MKQHITKEQWDELNENQQIILLKVIYKDGWFEQMRLLRKYDNFVGDGMINIGQIIDFLGDNWMKAIAISNNDEDVKYVRFEERKEVLCDYLWEAVKYKLK